MSGALSSSVPSRSNSTTRGNAVPASRGSSSLFPIPGFRLHRAGGVVHFGAPREPRGIAPRLVYDAAHVLELQARFAQPAAELGRLDEVAVLVRAFRQQARDVLGADDRQRERGRRAVERGHETAPAGPEPRRAGRQGRAASGTAERKSGVEGTGGYG